MSRRSQSGATLVELSVVLVVVAIVAAAAYPLLGNVLQVMTSKGAAEQVAGAIRQARQYAITKGSLHCIQFSGTPETNYAIKEASGSSSASDCNGTTIGTEQIRSGMGDAAIVSPANLTVIFDPIGSVAWATTGAPPVSVSVDTVPASCLSTITISLYGGVRQIKC
jgi:prepilin-type N-terminal cleavage/methylation domain-containing protein